MMGLARLSKKCQICPYVLTCNHKEMEALAYMKEATRETGINAAQPVLIPHDFRNIKIDENTTVTIDIEELKRQLEQEIYKSAGLMFGA